MNMNEIYSLANREIKNRRSIAILNAEENRIKAMQNEKYKEISNKIGELTILIAKARFKGEDSKEYEKQFDDAKKAEIEILNKIGIAKQDLEPKWTCEKCQDKGVVGNRFCECFNNLVSEITNKNNMNVLKPVTFNDCDEIDEKIKQKVVSIVNAYPAKRDFINLYFTGSVGTGKTYLTQAIANKFIQKKLFVIFTSATNLNNNFLEYHKSFDSDKENFLQPFLDCDVLIIDDLGTEPMLKNVTQEYLLTVISERILNQKMTIITTNLSSMQFIDRYGERLFSRLFDKNNSITFNFVGKDLRLKKK